MQVTIDLTGFLAIWGAVLSTIAILWDVYKWRTSGPKLKMRVSTNMKTINMPEFDGKTLISVSVSNRGDRPTTLTNFGIAYYDKWWKALLKRKLTQGAIVTTPSISQRIPFELKTGAEWVGMADQDTDISTWAREGWLYAQIYHSHSDKPIRKRIIIRDKKTK